MCKHPKKTIAWYAGQELWKCLDCGEMGRIKPPDPTKMLFRKGEK